MDENHTTEKIYIVQELAEIWRCSPDVIYDLLRRGKLHGFKLGAAWRVREQDRLAYEQGGGTLETMTHRPSRASRARRENRIY